MKRREFIGTSATTLAAANFAWAMPAEHRIKAVGLQLYSVRGTMKTDFEGTLGKVAHIGYKEVEFAGYFDHSPKEIRAILDKDGLTAPSCHVPLETVQSKLAEQIDAAHVIGHKFIVCPYIDDKMRKEPDGYKRIAETFDKAGEETRKAGIQFAYHNHTFEFQPAESLGGKLPYDFLLASTKPENVKMEMDLCWISVAGKDPVDYFNKYPGRFPLVHVKDMKRLPSKEELAKVNPENEMADMTEVGNGIIPWKKIFADSERAGIQHYFVEHDFPADPFASITKSYQYLSTLTF